MEGRERFFMNSNTTFAHVSSLSNWNAWCILLYYCKGNYTIILLHMCAIFRCPYKTKICLMENLGYWSPE